MFGKSSSFIQDSCVYVIVSNNVEIIDKDGVFRFDVDIDLFKYMYIGMTNDFERRMGEHLYIMNKPDFTTSQKLYNRLRDRGWENYNKIVIARDLTQEEAKVKEIETIAEYKTFELGLNSTPGGDIGLCGGDNPNAEAVNLYNNTTGEIVSFLYMRGADRYLGVKDRVKNDANPNGGSHQIWSPIHNAYFQAKKASDDTPFVIDMPTPREKISKGKRKKIVVVNIITKIEQNFDCADDAASYFGILKINIFKVINREENIKQFTVKTGKHIGRYDAQYVPKTREWDYDILPKNKAQALKKIIPVVAFDEDANLIYDFNSVGEAIKHTGHQQVSKCITHKIAFAGRTVDGHQIRWEYKDEEKRKFYDDNLPRSNKSERIYFFLPNGEEEIFYSKKEAASKTRGTYALYAQYDAISASLLSNGKKCCKNGNIWYRKNIVYDK